ncbi:hypothetical protein MKZ38_010244 [Zalerion maritima]|uniref:Large ribosomal subunit protein bL17m n=1 Tax=Zalerion maritima TaxID=339359 RepID=A0AAD5RTV6_9PEZI|nr:hypothetical protein MKZ38_010244 [Zalerion maritima]
MAGGKVKYRHLSRNSAHRQALLRNLTTSLIAKESIHTTYAKAKEAQRFAEKLITLAKRGTTTAKRQAQGILYTPHLLLPKLWGPIRERYKSRAGGYTRILITEPKDPIDQGKSAILELVDGKRDMRFHITAATVARDRQIGNPHTDLTLLNKKKVTQGRKNGEEEFEDLVRKFEDMKVALWETDGYEPEEPEYEGGMDDEGFEDVEEDEGQHESHPVVGGRSQGEGHSEQRQIQSPRDQFQERGQPQSRPRSAQNQYWEEQQQGGGGMNELERMEAEMHDQKRSQKRLQNKDGGKAFGGGGGGGAWDKMMGKNKKNNHNNKREFGMRPKAKRGSKDQFDTILDASHGKKRRKDIHATRASF